MEPQASKMELQGAPEIIKILKNREKSRFQTPSRNNIEKWTQKSLKFDPSEPQKQCSHCSGNTIFIKSRLSEKVPKISQERSQKRSPNRQKSMSGSLGKCKLKMCTKIFEILYQHGPNMGPKWVPKSPKNWSRSPLAASWTPRWSQTSPRRPQIGSNKPQMASY